MPKQRLLACKCGHTTFEGSLVSGTARLSCYRCRREYTMEELIAAQSSEPIEPRPIRPEPEEGPA